MTKKLFFLFVIVQLISLKSFSSVHVVLNHNDTGAYSFRALVDSAAAGDTIRFHPTLLSGGSDTIKFNGHVIINKALRIVGLHNVNDTLYFSGQGVSGILNISIPLLTGTDRNVRLDSLNFIQGYSSSGGAILAGLIDSLFVSNSSFFDNQSINNGGAISINNSASTQSSTVVYSANNSFRNNHAGANGGAISIYRVRNTNTSVPSIILLTIQNCDFLENTATSNGGAISLNSTNNYGFSFYDTLLVTSTISNTVFKNNQSDNGGGFCHWSNHNYGVINIDLNSCLVDSNVAIATSSSGGNGGFMSLQNFINDMEGSLDIKNSQFVNNSAISTFGGFVTGNGGAVNMRSILPNISIDTCSFIDNSGGYGGVMSIFCDVCDSIPARIKIDSSQFLNNNANAWGGVLYYELEVDSVLIDHSIFNNNSGGYGGVICDVNRNGVCVINSSEFNGNIGSRGGVCYGHTYLLHSVIMNNNLASHSGGALYSKIIDANNCEFHLDSAGYNGGALYCEKEIHLANCNLTRNHSSARGGAIYLTETSFTGSSSHLKLIADSTAIDSNSAVVEGASIYGITDYPWSTTVDTIMLIFNNSSSSNNTGGDNIYLKKTGSSKNLFYANNSNFDNNAQQVLYAEGGYVNSNSCTFNDNGNGISSKKVDIFNSEIKNNAGHAIYALNDSVLCLNTSITDNLVGIYCNRHLYLKSSEVKGCSQGPGLEVIYAFIDSSTISNNYNPLSSGGGFKGWTLTLKNSHLDSNSSQFSGGGADLLFAEISNSSINFNSAALHGGGIYTEKSYAQFLYYSFSEVTLDTCELIGNTAGLDGGAIHLNGEEPGSYSIKYARINLSLNSSTISLNAAGRHGGGFYGYIAQNEDPNLNQLDSTVRSVKISLLNSTISNNTAIEEGGGIWATSEYSGGLSVGTFHKSRFRVSIYSENSTITLNQAQTGGAIYCFTDPIYYSQYSKSHLSFKKSTIYENHADTVGGIYNKGRRNFPNFLSSVFADNDSINYFMDEEFLSYGNKILSLGYNIFSEQYLNAISTDQVSVLPSSILLDSLQNNGGLTATRLPLPGSVAINNGNPMDSSDAQNGILSYIRDVGAAESQGCGQTSTYHITNCDSFFWQVDSSTYSQSGTYNYLDSVGSCITDKTIQLTINLSFDQTDTIESCEQYTWGVNNEDYTSSGFFTETFETVNGCDSVHNLLLEIHPEKFTNESYQFCDSYYWEQANQTIFNTGVYQHTFQTIHGCDSNVTLNLSKELVEAEISIGDSLIGSVYSAQDYQWLKCDSAGFQILSEETNQEFQPLVDGMYALVTENYGCLDTSDCLNIGIVGLKNVAAPSISIFPNPSSGSILVSGIENYDQLSIYSADGRLLKSILLGGKTEHEITFDVAPGIYFIHLKSSQEEHVSRVIKI